MSRALLAIALLLVSPHLRAGFIGHSIGLTYEDHFVPSFTLIGEPLPPPVVITLQDFGTQTIGSGVEFPNTFAFEVDLSDSAIRFHTLIDFFSAISLSPFTGFRFHDTNGTLPDIVGVSIGLDSHFGLDPSKVSFDADNVLINLSGMGIDSGLRLAGPSDGDFCGPGICQQLSTFEYAFTSELVLNVQFAQVPEPATVPMLGAGLFVLAMVRRRWNMASQNC